MELTPSTGVSRSSNGLSAECRCPPGTAQHQESTSCYKLYEQGPCDIGQYFAPVNEPANTAIMYATYHSYALHCIYRFNYHRYWWMNDRVNLFAFISDQRNERDFVKHYPNVAMEWFIGHKIPNSIHSIHADHVRKANSLLWAKLGCQNARYLTCFFVIILRSYSWKFFLQKSIFLI